MTNISDGTFCLNATTSVCLVDLEKLKSQKRLVKTAQVMKNKLVCLILFYRVGNGHLKAMVLIINLEYLNKWNMAVHFCWSCKGSVWINSYSHQKLQLKSYGTSKSVCYIGITSEISVFILKAAAGLTRVSSENTTVTSLSTNGSAIVNHNNKGDVNHSFKLKI